MNLFNKRKRNSKIAYPVLVENYAKRLRVDLVDVVVRNNTKKNTTDNARLLCLSFPFIRSNPGLIFRLFVEKVLLLLDVAVSWVE